MANRETTTQRSDQDFKEGDKGEDNHRKRREKKDLPSITAFPEGGALALDTSNP